MDKTKGMTSIQNWSSMFIRANEYPQKFPSVFPVCFYEALLKDVKTA